MHDSRPQNLHALRDDTRTRLRRARAKLILAAGKVGAAHPTLFNLTKAVGSLNNGFDSKRLQEVANTAAVVNADSGLGSVVGDPYAVHRDGSHGAASGSTADGGVAVGAGVGVIAAAAGPLGEPQSAVTSPATALGTPQEFSTPRRRPGTPVGGGRSNSPKA